VAFVNYGTDYGKPVVIVDVANEQRALVEGTNFPRSLYPLKRLSLTRMTLPVNRGSRTGTLKKVIAKEGFEAKWAASPVAKKLAAKSTRDNLSDLERFQVMINRKRRAFAVRKVAAKMTGKAKKGGAKGGKDAKGGKGKGKK